MPRDKRSLGSTAGVSGWNPSRARDRRSVSRCQCGSKHKRGKHEKRILVVEDQQDNRLRDLLTSADFEVIEAEDGEAGCRGGSASA